MILKKMFVKLYYIVFLRKMYSICMYNFILEKCFRLELVRFKYNLSDYKPYPARDPISDFIVIDLW